MILNILTSISTAVVHHLLRRSPVTVMVSPFAVMEYPSARPEGWVEREDKVRADACLSRETAWPKIPAGLILAHRQSVCRVGLEKTRISMVHGPHAANLE
jgi:hypothetical protein